MKVLVNELMFLRDRRIRAGSIIDWDAKVPVPPCCEVVEDDATPEKARKKPGPKPREVNTFSEMTKLEAASKSFN